MSIENRISGLVSRVAALEKQIEEREAIIKRLAGEVFAANIVKYLDPLADEFVKSENETRRMIDASVGATEKNVDQIRASVKNNIDSAENVLRTVFSAFCVGR